VRAGFHPQRSGDVIFVLKPNWLMGFNKGTTHGSPYKYDTHVPLIWWGYTIKPGSTSKPTAITQIAPTIAKLLKIDNPKECNSQPIKLSIQ
jgi:predicted AlkP superfamily pyrophosphatase or phosphodiesterase